MQPLMEPLVRYTPPTRYDVAPYGAVCTVKGETELADQMYIQVNKDDSIANWIDIGTFLEIIFKDKMHDPVFVAQCLDRYK